MDLDTLIAKDAIRDVIYRYCRVLDRMDKPGAYDLWGENSTVLYHGIFEGSGPGFVDWVWGAHAAMQRHSHQINNVLIEVNGDTAVSESCVVVVLWTHADEDGSVSEILVRGRYLDDWSLQTGNSGDTRWVINRREHVIDMQSISRLVPGEVSEMSRRDEADASYALFARHA